MRIVAPMRLHGLFPLLFALFAGTSVATEAPSARSTMDAGIPVHELDPASRPSRKPMFSEVVLHGLSFLDIPYRFGGTTRDRGLDCSGLVQKVFAESLGMSLPRTTRGQADMGVKVARKDLKPGDLVFFNTRRRAYSHVGIYMGNDRFLHAPSIGGKVRIEKLSVSYWSKRFNGARRVIKPKQPQLTAVSDALR